MYPIFGSRRTARTRSMSRAVESVFTKGVSGSFRQPAAWMPPFRSMAATFSGLRSAEGFATKESCSGVEQSSWVLAPVPRGENPTRSKRREISL